MQNTFGIFIILQRSRYNVKQYISFYLSYNCNSVSRYNTGQSGQGDMGSTMGGNTMNQAFGSQGADKLLVKITTALATIFMVLSISIQLVGRSEVNDDKYMTDGEFTGNFEESKSEDVPIINLTTDSTDTE